MKFQSRRAMGALEYICKILDKANITVSRYMIMVWAIRSCLARSDTASWQARLRAIEESQLAVDVDVDRISVAGIAVLIWCLFFV